MGCSATTTITSKTYPNLYVNIKRVFVISTVAEEFGNAFAADFEKSLISYFKLNNIEARVKTIQEMELKLDLKPTIMSALSDFKPNVMMMINRSGGTKNKYGRLLSVEYDVKLIPEGNVILWRGKVSFYPAEFKSDSDILARDIINKLVADGVIKAK